MEQKLIYLDHAATTPVHPQVVEAMLPYWTERYGNASSIYSLGRQAGRAMAEARETVADILRCEPREVIFTGCGSESDNLALRGVGFNRRAVGKGAHLITSSVEHHAISHTVEEMVKHFGFEATFVPVDRYGVVDPAEVQRAIRPDTALISIMYANNEVGTVEPIAEIGALARERGIPFHTDAVQAGGSLPLDVQALQVDLMSLSAHKFYGPKGVGVLYARRGVPLWPTQTGGGHEGGRRAGTENVPYIVGLATALRLAYERLEEQNARLRRLRDQLIQGVLAQIPDSQLTGHPTQRLPNSASFVFRGIEGESILLHLDMEGVCASSGSACTSASLEPSHVLLAMGLPHEIAHGSLRLTLGHSTTEADIARVLEVLPGIVTKLRAMSPLYEGGPRQPAEVR
ncbi:MAG: cysteine desulfurase NifS [Chloroflexi bacterium]|nr:cysteine desulfurase NifS [Chloroflexota bacterium]